MTLKEIFVNKVTSGRYYLTLVGGVVFAFAVWKRFINDQATCSILTAIFMSYFQRSDRNGKEIQK